MHKRLAPPTKPGLSMLRGPSGDVAFYLPLRRSQMRPAGGTPRSQGRDSEFTAFRLAGTENSSVAYNIALWLGTGFCPWHGLRAGVLLAYRHQAEGKSSTRSGSLPRNAVFGVSDCWWRGTTADAPGFGAGGQ